MFSTELLPSLEQQISALCKQYTDLSSQSTNYQPELELRFNHYTNENKTQTMFGIPYDVWIFLKRKAEQASAKTEQTVDTIRMVGNYRCITASDAPTIYQNKKKLQHIDFDLITHFISPKDYKVIPVRLSLATEESLSQSQFSAEVKQFITERKRTRTTCYFPKLSKTISSYLIRLDFTMI